MRLPHQGGLVRAPAPCRLSSCHRARDGCVLLRDHGKPAGRPPVGHLGAPPRVGLGRGAPRDRLCVRGHDCLRSAHSPDQTGAPPAPRLCLVGHLRPHELGLRCRRKLLVAARWTGRHGFGPSRFLVDHRRNSRRALPARGTGEGRRRGDRERFACRGHRRALWDVARPAGRLEVALHRVELRRLRQPCRGCPPAAYGRPSRKPRSRRVRARTGGATSSWWS